MKRQAEKERQAGEERQIYSRKDGHAGEDMQAGCRGLGMQGIEAGRREEDGQAGKDRQ
jgi:hypothetical protein